MSPTVDIDCFVDELQDYGADCAVVAIDVIRATTTAITAVDTGRRLFPAPSLSGALKLAERLQNALLVGELGGSMPDGFDLTNSPAAIFERTDWSRPAVLLSTSGTPLVCAAARYAAGYAACMRNWSYQANWLATNHDRVAIVGAATRGEFREEDQICSAWIAAALVDRGFQPTSRASTVIQRWREAPSDAAGRGKSGDYLRRTGQEADLDFVLSHVDDVEAVFVMNNGELVRQAGE